MHFSHLFLFLSFMVPSSSARSWMVKPGCRETCGNSNVSIPYPFGIGPGCALKKSYSITCELGSSNDSPSTPYLRIQRKKMEVLEVSLMDQTITIKNQVSQVCESQRSSNSNSTSVFINNLEGSPFFLSKEFNKLMLLGCGDALLYHKGIHDTQVFLGCTSTCKLGVNATGCNGINCCQTNIPFYLNQYHLNFTISDFNRSCASAFVATEYWKPERFSAQNLLDVPVVLSWTLQSSDVQGISGCIPQYAGFEIESGQFIENMQCACSSSTGGASTLLLQYKYVWYDGYNAYLDGACDHAISLLKSGKKNKTGAIVSLLKIVKNNETVAIVGGTGVGFVVLLLMIATYSLYKLVKKRRNKQRKKKFFKRNGGLLLQQQLSAEEGVVEKTKIFTAKELNKASDGFNANRVLGQGGQGTVYKGMLTDGRIVAIKKSKKVDENQLEQFINEVVILSEVNHRNVVKLLGCCLETEVPLLVYEFIPNGTLSSLVHNENDEEFPLTWNVRLRIASEVAGALAYLHSAISIPIFHRDIKSSNILLDEKYIAKISDFGTSRSVAIDKTHLTTRVQGTFGYLDPEYFQSSQFTEKSDVYSFGVVLVELLTRQKPISAGTGENDNLSLATRFLIAMDQNSLPTILDPQVVDQSNEEEVLGVAKLAQQCLNLTGKKRPTMKEVVFGLESIKMSSVHSAAQETPQTPSFAVGKSVVFSDTDNSWTTESASVRITSDDSPLLINISSQILVVGSSYKLCP